MSAALLLPVNEKEEGYKTWDYSTTSKTYSNVKAYHLT